MAEPALETPLLPRSPVAAQMLVSEAGAVRPAVVARALGVSKCYRPSEPEVLALRDVDLSIRAGEFVALAGPSGSGKTTLLNLLGALDTPTAGEIEVAGRRLGGMSRSDLADLRLRQIGFVFQSYNLLPVLSALENAEFVLELQGVEKSERRRRAQQSLQAVGMADLMQRRPRQLSGGQQQRVAVARAIAGRPALVLADEPTASLDSKNAERLLDLLLELNRERGITFVFTSHDQRVLERARRLVTLEDGVILKDEVQA